ncbi:hypothetical protein BP5796_01210 [Coleophoma crateriformis]|uniref:C2H2-type domain-containing protein n=1 Tax=Coleophoma crateriformis TaxID=565419 RepID=A0A3D8SZT8_9HELO|nr:hypothetical protein BP5796_01210 [Coleophoma crateriformis]
MKRHTCKVPGCGKAFTRPSHLQRHALNHSHAQWICERCSACFKRQDLLERHKDRHAARDKIAGGTGLGVLETKSKHFRESSNVGSPSRRQSSSSTSPRYQSLTSESQRLSIQRNVSPDDRRPQRFQEPGALATAISNGSNSSVSPEGPHSAWETRRSTLGAQSQTDYAYAQMPFSQDCQPQTAYQPLEHSPGFYEMGNIYYDIGFDSVHFNVNAFNLDCPPLSESRNEPIVITEDANFCPSQRIENEAQEVQASLLLAVDKRLSPQTEMRNTQSTAHVEMESSENALVSRHELSRTSPVHVDSEVLPRPSASESALSQANDADLTTRTLDKITGGDKNISNLNISLEKRAEILEFISEIEPHRPNGTLINESSSEFSLENMQNYLNLFMEYFNTSYPIIHVATLDVGDTEPVALISMILLGATYKDKDAHQFSVCLYDAVVPYIMNGLLVGPVPDLSILQAFLILECYGMYRAGPYQRENAILIHGLIWNSIRRISRYHVRASISLPDRLTHKERDWMEFAYAEQYKRLILYFFIWDTQNVTLYSFMPSMSNQSIQIGLPCSKKLWEARSEEEWKILVLEHDETHTFMALMKRMLASDHEMLSKPYDILSFTLVLHGLMSMCNDMLHFDNRSIYLGNLEEEDASWSPWRQQMAHALESWKARYDAFAMETIWDMQSEPLHCEFQRDSMSLFALYHTAHIVINCEVRHLQTAAGAKAIFGHIVTPSDYEESCAWVRQWIKASPKSAGRAAWHAAQMFREGMLNLQSWDVHGVFFYPWCLYIGTLTCWAFHHFGTEAAAMEPCCDHSTTAGKDKLLSGSRNLMNHLVATMASVTPVNMDRVMGNCCTHGLTIEMAKYLRGVRWTAAYEAMKILEALSWGQEKPRNGQEKAR